MKLGKLEEMGVRGGAAWGNIILCSTVEDLGLNIPSVWEDYCGAAIRPWTQILNDEGALGNAARASLQQATTRFRHWLFELTFYSHKGRPSLCPSVMARNMATSF